MIKYVREARGMSEKIAVLKLELDDKTKITLVQVYAPTASAPELDLIILYEELDEVYDKEK